MMLICMCALNAYGQAVESSVQPDDVLKKAREGFFKAGEEPCFAPELENIIGESYTNSSLLQAYKGAASTINADCLRSPAKKLKSFKQGRELLDQAIEKEPDNPEIRFIRYMVQDGAPAFLNYDDRDADLQIWFDYYSVNANEPATFTKKMAKAINKTDYPDSDQREMLGRILKNN